jgi:L-serine deaminase
VVQDPVAYLISNPGIKRNTISITNQAVSPAGILQTNIINLIIGFIAKTRLYL